MWSMSSSATPANTFQVKRLYDIISILQTNSDFENLALLLPGLNEDSFRPSMKVLNGGTSLGHCVSTLLSVIHANFGVEEFDITSVQASNENNNIVDGVMSEVEKPGDWRLGRADNNIIPFHNTKTLKEIAKVVPDYSGRLSSSGFLVPTFPVSVLDVQIKLTREATLEEVTNKVRKLAAAGPQRRLVGHTEDMVVSSDLVGESTSCLLDAGASEQLAPDTVKLVAW